MIISSIQPSYTFQITDMFHAQPLTLNFISYSNISLLRCTNPSYKYRIFLRTLLFSYISVCLSDITNILIIINDYTFLRHEPNAKTITKPLTLIKGRETAVTPQIILQKILHVLYLGEKPPVLALYSH